MSVTSAPQIHDLRPSREPGPTPCVQSASTSMHINRVLGLGTGGDVMIQIVSGVRRLFAVTRDFVFAAFDDEFWEGCGR